MTKDNSTGKDKEFYELGKKMFDRLNPPGTPPFKPYVSKREWAGLTDEDIQDWIAAAPAGMLPLYLRNLIEGIEAELKEKNS